MLLIVAPGNLSSSSFLMPSASSAGASDAAFAFTDFAEGVALAFTAGALVCAYAVTANAASAMKTAEDVSRNGRCMVFSRLRITSAQRRLRKHAFQKRKAIDRRQAEISRGAKTRRRRAEQPREAIGDKVHRAHGLRAPTRVALQQQRRRRVGDRTACAKHPAQR